MSKVKIQGNASGTGVFTIEAPGTNDPRTITLPNSTGTLLDENSSLPAANLTGTVADARLPDPLPAISGAALTNLPAGDLVYRTSSTGSSVANVDITTGFSASDYNLYMIALDGVVSLSSGSTLQMRISNDGGSTWLSSCYSRGGGYDFDDTRFSYQTSNSPHWTISHAGPVSWPGRSGIIWLTNTGTTYVTMNCSITGNDSTSAANGPCWFNGCGMRVATTTANAVRFQMSTGNMHGKFHLYGVKKA